MGQLNNGDEILNNLEQGWGEGKGYFTLTWEVKMGTTRWLAEHKMRR